MALRTLQAAVYALLAAGCGPATSSSNAADGGASSANSADGGHTSTSVGVDTGHATLSASSDTTASANSDTTGETPACGDGLLEPGEWCFDRLSVDIAELGLEQAFRVISTQDGLIVWGDNGLSLLSVNGDMLGFENEPFYWGAYAPGYVIFRAKLTTLGSGRPDLVFWQPVEFSPDIDPSLVAQFVFLSPGASRPDPGSDAGYLEIQGLDWALDDLVAPLNVDGDGMDDVFAYDRHSGHGAVYRAEAPLPRRPRAFYAEQLDLLAFKPPCPPVAIHTGDFNGDGVEDGVIVSPECPTSREGATLYTFAGQQSGLLAQDPSAVAAPLIQGQPTLEVFDINGDAFDDLVIAQTGQLLVFSGGQGGLSKTQLLPVSPLEVVIDGPAHIGDNQRPILTVGSGQFDLDEALELLVNTESGITAVSLEFGVIGEFPDTAGSFAVYDINADGVSDVAAIVDGQVVLYRSSP